MQMQKLLVHLFVLLALLSVQVQAPLQANNLLKVNKITDRTAEQTLKQKADKVIKLWVNEISKNEDFISFAEASWSISSLGPGTHSYLVTFYNDKDGLKNTIGYLILHMAETGGFYIGEYGKGHFEGLNTYEERPLQALYLHPFEAIYIDEQQEAFELFTNENYPLDLTNLEQKQRDFTSSLHADFMLIQASSYSNSLSMPYFSPYSTLIWLTSLPINNQLIDDRSIETEIEFEQQLFYRTKNWNNKISTVFAVTALHKWNNNQLYIGLQLDDEQSIRYISYDQLLELGSFYSS